MIVEVHVEAFAARPRREAIDALKRSIAHAGGSLRDFAFVAREGMWLTVELVPGATHLFSDALDAAGFAFSTSAARAIAGAGALPASATVVVLLQVTFEPAGDAAAAPSALG